MCQQGRELCLEETWHMEINGEQLDRVTREYFKNKMAGDVQLGLQNRAGKPSLCFGRESWVMKRIK